MQKPRKEAAAQPCRVMQAAPRLCWQHGSEWGRAVPMSPWGHPTAGPRSQAGSTVAETRGAVLFVTQPRVRTRKDGCVCANPGRRTPSPSRPSRSLSAAESSIRCHFPHDLHLPQATAPAQVWGPQGPLSSCGIQALASREAGCRPKQKLLGEARGGAGRGHNADTSSPGVQWGACSSCSTPGLDPETRKAWRSTAQKPGPAWAPHCAQRREQMMPTVEIPGWVKTGPAGLRRAHPAVGHSLSLSVRLA